MENKGEHWSRGTNSCLPFGVNVNLNLRITTFSRQNDASSPVRTT